MLNKLYKKLLEIIKENWLSFLIIIILLLNIGITLPYGIYKPGGTINVDERLSNKQYENKGTFNMTYVSYLDGKISNLIIAFFTPSWKIVSIDKIKYSQEDLTDMNNRERIDLYESISNAKYVAYNYANYPLNIKETKYYISYIDPKVKTELKTGDIFLSINDITFEDLEDYLNNIEPNTELEVKIIRNNKEKIVKTKTILLDNKTRIGIYLAPVNTYDDNLEYKYKKSESGSSGGLMLSLAIYNSLIKEDITGGLKVCGTGTIDKSGNVGEIGSVRYKVLSAIKDECDIFFVPNKNYKDSLDELNKTKTQMKLYEVSTFTDAINILNEKRI